MPNCVAIILVSYYVLDDELDDDDLRSMLDELETDVSLVDDCELSSAWVLVLVCELVDSPTVDELLELDDESEDELTEDVLALLLLDCDTLDLLSDDVDESLDGDWLDVDSFTVEDELSELLLSLDELTETVLALLLLD